MEHPFEVGKLYRNRKGEYEVVSLDGPRMVIRYADGSVLQTRVDLQARIWRNIQTEARVERETQRAQAQKRLKRRGARRGLDFQGLGDHDFQKGVAGTSWRARTSFGGRLAERMTSSTAHFFQSWAIYRKAEVHIAQPVHYNSREKAKVAKFVFDLYEKGSWYGFLIEKNNGPMDSTWHWPNMIEALSSGARLQEEIEQAMRAHDLRWQLYVWGDGSLVEQIRAAEEGLMREVPAQQEREESTWTDFVDDLRSLDAEVWHSLLLLVNMSKEKALAAGPGLVDPVAEVLKSLLPLYEASTGQG
jgi:hypothetical protein